MTEQQAILVAFNTPAAMGSHKMQISGQSDRHKQGVLVKPLQPHRAVTVVAQETSVPCASKWCVKGV